MIFKFSMRSLSSSASAVREFADKTDRSIDEAQATLQAYASGSFLPTHSEMMLAYGKNKDLLNEWKRAVVALNAVRFAAAILATGVGVNTLGKWRIGSSTPIKTRLAALKSVGIDMYEVPDTHRYAHVDRPYEPVQFDLRRSKLLVLGTYYPLQQVGAQAYVVPYDLMQGSLLQDLHNAGLQTQVDGSFIRAVIPASEVTIFMYPQNEHST